MASAREYLRSGMPAIYRDDPDGFAMFLLGCLERVLDPQVAILDCLAAYLSASLAPEGMVEAMAAWLGLPPAETYGQSAGRELLMLARQLAMLRGTRAGLELALSRCFLELRFEVEDHGGVLHSGDSAAATPYPGFTVRCRESLSPVRREEVRRTIEWQQPLQVDYRLLEGPDTREAPP